MKWLFLLLLAVVIFGGAAFFSYDLFVKPERKIEQEKSGEIPVEPVPDVSLPEFQAAAKLRQEGKLLEARDALMTFMQHFPNGLHIEEAKDLLGQVNIEMLFSDYRFAGKTGIHRAQRRRAGEDRGENQNDARVDHADE